MIIVVFDFFPHLHFHMTIIINQEILHFEDCFEGCFDVVEENW